MGFTVFDWAIILKIARTYGWVPSGTTLELEKPWNPSYDGGDFSWSGAYDSNDGQKVSSADASNLSRALSKALSDVPNEDRLAKLRDSEGGGDFEKLRNANFSPIDWFSGPERKQVLVAFIQFCQQGEFTIH